MLEVIEDIRRWQESGEDVALATVVSTWGSSPRGVGAKMAFTSNTKIAGSVSGGCVEGAVIDAGIQILTTGDSKLLNFGVADETAFEVGLACGGSIEVFVTKVNPELLIAIQNQLSASVVSAVVTVIAGPLVMIGKTLLHTKEHTYGSINPDLDEITIKIAAEALLNNRSGDQEVETGAGEKVRLFIDVIPPPPVLVMVGGVHIAITLSALAKALGYHTIVIDPRKVFGSEERFPEVDQLIQAWPNRALEQISLNSSTAVAVLTHDPKIDDPALKVVLESDVFYIGVLGSRKTHEKRRQRLLAAGISPALLDQLHAPIGIDLGGCTPEETALEVMAQITSVRRGHTG